ncbi:hydrogenase maturation nickel metallochaperone HypA/HybF [Arabiibacter massiliensis]|uniref:hydrogenase maturation nickel metallochaperone HypA/HybF n=1 Tax=Arabiibacter massiliensis TaxID=1870985 RepID=UPI0009BAD135|nr:hydrogenase maturation nickel metallochaperone HypA [Arabiibacter massiliensis]
MHEMALVRSVVDIVVERAEAAGVDSVDAVYLTIGYGRDIVEDYFDGLFAFLARGTVAEHAELVIERVPVTARCNGCGFVFPLDVFDRSTWAYPSCHAERNYQIVSGREFYISHIDVTTSKELARAAG